MIDLDRCSLDMIKQILQQHVPHCKVLAFGSRVNNQKHHSYADLDLALICPDDQKLDWQRMEQLREAFSQSDLSIMVDVTLWNDLPLKLQKHIQENGEKLSLQLLARQDGFTIVQAIFILVVLALLGTYMVSLSTIGQATSTQALMQARAYQAARAGLEWGIALVTNSVDHTAALGKCNDIGTDKIVTVGDYGGEVKVTCTLSGSYNEDGDVGVYNLTAIATFADISSPDYVSRKLEVTIHD